jgi:hypothetical protein
MTAKLHVQLGRFGSPPAMFATINAAIWSETIAREVGSPASVDRSALSGGIWRRRIGTLLFGEDRWWCLEPMPAWATHRDLAPIFDHGWQELPDLVDERLAPVVIDLADPEGLLRWWLTDLDRIERADEFEAAAVLAWALDDTDAKQILLGRLDVIHHQQDVQHRVERRLAD